MKTLIDKVNYFEDGEETVEAFNRVFENCPLENFCSTDIVTIGIPCSPETCRQLTINGVSFRHDFKPKAPDIDMEDPARTGEYTARKAAGLPFWKNLQGEYYSPTQPEEPKGENLIMTKKEMELKPLYYFLLQYFRGSTSNYYTVDQISKDLGVCCKTVGKTLPEMQENGIVTVTNEMVNNKKKKRIVTNEAWV